jgi:hypothetical protein
MNQCVTDNIPGSNRRRLPEQSFTFFFTGLLSLLVFLAPQAAVAFDHSHKLFSVELRKYVRADGILYARWQKKREGLERYIESLSTLSESEYKEFDLQQKEALWLNAYNALAVKLVLDHYPIAGKNPRYPSDSIRQIPDTWNAVSCKIAGREVSLYTIAHDILRRDRDCRTHFAVVPAARGGGAMTTRAYQPQTVEQELDDVTRSFMARPENLTCDVRDATITVSQIFKWFPLDFFSCTGDGRIPMPPPQDDDVVREYVSQFLNRDEKAKLKGKEIKMLYAPYDWSLNEAGRHTRKHSVR